MPFAGHTLAAALLAASFMLPSALPAAAQPVQTQTPADTARALSDLVVLGPMMDQMIDAMAAPMAQMLERDFPGRGQVVAAILVEEMQVEFARLMPELEDQVALMMARHFTHQEMLELLAFYESPLGQRTLEVMPAMMTELMPYSMQFGERVAAGVMPRVMTRLQALDAPAPQTPAPATGGK